MVAPTAFSKESSTPSGVTGSSEKSKGGGIQVPIKEEHNVAPAAAAANKSCKPAKLGWKIIMNPAVLSIISHFPNKCIPNKSEKYVVNGLTLSTTTLSLEKGSVGDLDTKSVHNNNNISDDSSVKPGKTNPTSKLKRYAGLLLAILSSMMFSFTGLIVKLLPHHHPLTQATWMFIATFILAVPLNLFKYVFNYYNNEDCEQQQLHKSGSFKQFPDNGIEPVKVLEPQGQDGAKSEKGLVGLPLPTAADLISISQNRLALRQLKERRRKIKLALLLVIRACSGCSGMIFYFYSLRYLNVGDSLVIVCSTPVFVSIIGYLFLGESCGVIPVLTIIMSMIGVAVITRPPMLTGQESFQTEDMVGAGLAFSSMLCIAITIIMMRHLQNVYHGLINLVFAIWGSLQTTTIALAVGVLECPRDLQDAVLMLATGVLFFLGQTFLAVALQYEEAGPVALVRTSEVVFAFVWQFIFLSVRPDLFSISGAGLILAGIFLTISRKWIASMPEDSRGRKLFGVLLR